MTSSKSVTIACFVTNHGFGHAARSSAVLKALQTIIPALDIHIFTQVPEWFFTQTLDKGFTYHDCFTDVGIFQTTPLDENIPATIQKLNLLLPPDESYLSSISKELTNLNCRFVLSDISPIGILAGNQACIPTVLQENFTWDWIYKGYVDKYPDLQKYIQPLESIYQNVQYHIQTEPLCNPLHNATLHANPISRSPLHSPKMIRSMLGLPQGSKAILLTMEGIPPSYDFLSHLKKYKDIFFVLPGAHNGYHHEENLIMFPHHSKYYHPDLVNSMDAVIGKAGYSTISEVYYSGIPFAFISRTHFREAPFLSKYILENMNGFEIPEIEFATLSWMDRIPELLEVPRKESRVENGASQVANALSTRLK